jgi:hypothetical protein
MGLRERGIYTLPNGRELIVISNLPNGSIRMRGWERFEPSEFEVDTEGRLFAHGKPTAWDINQLTDTGRTASELSYMFEADSQQSVHDHHTS